MSTTIVMALSEKINIIKYTYIQQIFIGLLIYIRVTKDLVFNFTKPKEVKQYLQYIHIEYLVVYTEEMSRSFWSQLRPDLKDNQEFAKQINLEKGGES